MKRMLSVAFAVVVGLMFSFRAFAHHGTGAYDISKTITARATVTRFEWSNPHCLLYFDFKDDKGQSQLWSIQMYAPLYLGRAGWNRNTLKPGDKIAASFHPAKNGAPIGYIRDGDDSKIVLDGRQLNLNDHVGMPAGQR